MSRANRVFALLDAMSDEERAELFADLAETYCVDCGQELPDAESDEPDHECEHSHDDDEEDDEDDEDGGDESELDVDGEDEEESE